MQRSVNKIVHCISLEYLLAALVQNTPGAQRVTNCNGTCTVGVNMKREMVLSPNDEVVCSKKRTYPIQD